MTSSYAGAVLPALLIMGLGFGMIFAPAINTAPTGVRPGIRTSELTGGAASWHLSDAGEGPEEVVPEACTHTSLVHRLAVLFGWTVARWAGSGMIPQQCDRDGCTGVRLAGGLKCLAHASKEEQDTALEQLRTTGMIDARGVQITSPLLGRILASAPRDAHNHPLFSQAGFGGATFEGDAGFNTATFKVLAMFGGATFEGDAGFRGAAFGGEARFGQATFERDAEFGGATFEGFAGFDGATFEGDAGFGGATFENDASLNGATFKRLAMFMGATFKRETTFGMATFGRWAGFGATFKGDAGFGGATFENDAEFSRATFERDAGFGGATFKDNAGFGGATFKDNAGFGGATFKGSVTFQAADFEGSVRFDGVTFKGLAGFPMATFGGYAGFDGTTFEGEARFDGATFKRARQFGPLLAYRGLCLDGVQCAQLVQIEASTIGVYCRRAQFPGGVHFRLRWARVVLDDTDLAASSLLTGIPRLANPKLATPEKRIAKRWQRQEPDTISEQPRLLSLQRADVGGLELGNVSLADCRFDGAHNLDRLRLEADVAFAAAPAPLTYRQVIAEERAWRATRSGRWTAPLWPTWPGGEPPEVLDAGKIAGLYRALRKGREDAKDEPGAGDFYYGEMEMRRHARGHGGGRTEGVSRGRVERGVLTAYWLVSGYGLRALRSLAALVILCAIVTTALTGFGLAKSDLVTAPPQHLTGTITAVPHNPARITA
jgi:hypothetical protein